MGPPPAPPTAAPAPPIGCSREEGRGLVEGVGDGDGPGWPVNHWVGWLGREWGP